MTVELNDTIERFPIIGVGPYPFSFRIFDATELAVIAISGTVSYTLGLSTEFSVSGVDNTSGGTITLTSGAAATYAGYTLDIRSNTKQYQPTSIRNQGRFLEATHEDAFDRLSRQIQDLARKVKSSLRLPDNVLDDGTLASVDERKGKYFFFNATTGAIEYAINIGQTVISQSILAQLLYPQNKAESSLSAVPIRYLPYDDVRRFVVGDGIADDTAALNKVFDIARAGPAHGCGKYVSFIDGVTCKVSGTVNVSGVDIYAYGETVHIQAAPGLALPVLSTTGDTRAYGLRLDAGGTGAAGQVGDAISIVATAPAFPYVNQFAHCVVTNARRDAWHVERGGYTSWWACRTLGAGRHALYSAGTDLGANATTTLETGGSCQWGGTPNAAGIYIANAVNHKFHGDIIESTSGSAIQIAGDNRAHSFIGVYAENTGTYFIDWAGSTGIGIVVLGCFGGNARIDYNVNWLQQFLPDKGNSNISMPPPAPDSNVVIGDTSSGGEMIVSTASGASITSDSISLTPGLWFIQARLQVRVNSGSPTLARLGCTITADNADSGYHEDTANGSFVDATVNQRSIPGATGSLNASGIFRVTATTTYRLRSFYDINSGALGITGKLYALKL